MLFETYAELAKELPIPEGQLLGEQLPQIAQAWFAVDCDARPHVLVNVNDNSTKTDIQLQSISVRFSRKCEIMAKSGEITDGTYTIIRLEDDDPDILKILFCLLEEVISRPKSLSTNRAIQSTILEISELFREVENSTRDAIGLWGELYIISRASNISEFIKYWCAAPNSKYDFIGKQHALEAKTTLKPKREHRFSLEQLRPLNKFPVYIASITIVEAPLGKSVSELIDELYENIVDSALRTHFYQLCLKKAGEDIYRDNRRFAASPKDTSLALYHAESLPTPTIEREAPISNLRFDLDLTKLSQVTDDSITKIIGLRV